jgi:aminoglycoside 6'-N-acetyltransferase
MSRFEVHDVKRNGDLGFGADREGRAQSANRSAYAFRPAARQDLALLQRWLSTPEVVRWWGDPQEQAALLREDLEEPAMVMRIVSFASRPFAYAQDYPVHAWPQPHFAHLPKGSRAIDSFIGEPDLIGRGHGSIYLRLLAERLKAEGAPVVAIDPDGDNLRARRAYEKAGFRGSTVVETGEGPAILMEFAG